MALRRALAQRLFYNSEKSSTILSNCRISSSRKAVQTLVPPGPDKIAPDPGDNGVLRRLFQWRPIYQSSGAPAFRSLPTGEKLMEKLRALDIARDRIRLDGLAPPPSTSPEATREGALTVEDARKVLRLSQLEAVKLKLRRIQKDHISLSELVQICTDCCSNAKQGLEFAKLLDESGSVIVLGNVVFLKPEQESETNVGPDLKRVNGSTFEMVTLGSKTILSYTSKT
ncbi:hypothetical protein NMG60_11008030 [Bertholletia excelsa]